MPCLYALFRIVRNFLIIAYSVCFSASAFSNSSMSKQSLKRSVLRETLVYAARILGRTGLLVMRLGDFVEQDIHLDEQIHRRQRRIQCCLDLDDWSVTGKHVFLVSPGNAPNQVFGKLLFSWCQEKDESRIIQMLGKEDKPSMTSVPKVTELDAGHS